MKVFNCLIFFYILGYLVFLTHGELDTHLWSNTFHLWRNICFGGSLSWAALYYIGDKKVKAKAKWMFCFSLCLVGWEIVHIITGIRINDERAVFVLFLILQAILIVLLVKEHRAERRLK